MLYDKQRLETEDRGPILDPTWTVVDSPHDYYVKTPNLSAHAQPDIEKQIYREIEVCEILRKNPHPNIGLYFGCRVTRGRVSGICFKRYASTLLQKINPQHLNKSEFLTRGRPQVDDTMRAWLDGIQAGIYHLHSLDLVHNDITPANIMFEEDGSPVLIDFDSCRKVGEALHQTKRTYGWHDPDIDTALKKNDLDAFTELREWLIGSSPENYLFKRG